MQVSGNPLRLYYSYTQLIAHSDDSNFDLLLDNEEPSFASQCDVDLPVKTQDNPGHTRWQLMYTINAAQPE